MVPRQALVVGEVPVRDPVEAGGVDVGRRPLLEAVQLVRADEVHLAREHRAVAERARGGGRRSGPPRAARRRCRSRRCATAGAPRQQRAARGHAERRGAERALEHDALVAEPRERRRQRRSRLPYAGSARGRELVGDHEQDVRSRRSPAPRPPRAARRGSPARAGRRPPCAARRSRTRSRCAAPARRRGSSRRCRCARTRRCGGPSRLGVPWQLEAGAEPQRPAGERVVAARALARAERDRLGVEDAHAVELAAAREAAVEPRDAPRPCRRRSRRGSPRRARPGRSSRRAPARAAGCRRRRRAAGRAPRCRRTRTARSRRAHGRRDAREVVAAACPIRKSSPSGAQSSSATTRAT